MIIETDLGHDPDDIFALMYLISAGLSIEAVCLSPGDPYQVKLTRALLHALGCGHTKIFTPRTRIAKPLPLVGWNLEAFRIFGGTDDTSDQPDGHETELDALNYTGEVFVCGPVKMVHRTKFSSLTFQGGFVPYSLHQPRLKLDKFANMEFCPTFNLGGTSKGIALDLIHRDVPQRWVGKNVCHTFTYTEARHRDMLRAYGPSGNLRIFADLMTAYLQDRPEKAFHDPLAAVMHLHPELGTWICGKPVRKEGKWSTVLGAHHCLVDLPDHDIVFGEYLQTLAGKL